MPSTGLLLVVRVPDETRPKIDALAESRGRNLNDVLNEAIDRYHTEEEWLIDEISAVVAEAEGRDHCARPTPHVGAVDGGGLAAPGAATSSTDHHVHRR